jgi:hypothetical protein
MNVAKIFALNAMNIPTTPARHVKNSKQIVADFVKDTYSKKISIRSLKICVKRPNAMKKWKNAAKSFCHVTITAMVPHLRLSAFPVWIPSVKAVKTK